MMSSSLKFLLFLLCCLSKQEIPIRKPALYKHVKMDQKFKISDNYKGPTYAKPVLESITKVLSTIGDVNNEDKKERMNDETGTTQNPNAKVILDMANSISDAVKQADIKRGQVLDAETEEKLEPQEPTVPSPTDSSKENEKKKINVGTKKEITVQSEGGFSKMGSFRPPSIKITEQTFGELLETSAETEDESAKVYNYPNGVGPLIMNGCFESGYVPSDPCAQVRIPGGACHRMLDAAAFLGVGFDGRGFYSPESRKMSLIQRKCSWGKTFMQKQLPDAMNAFGIYNVDAETNAFSSSENYGQYLSSKSQVSSQKGMFAQEKSQISSSTSSGGDLEIVGAIAGAAAGAAAGGPVAAGAAAKLGQTIGKSISFSSSESSGSSDSNSKSNNEKKKEQSSKSSQEETKTDSMIAVLFINVNLYELTLDEVTPDTLTETFLQDFVELPDSYYYSNAPLLYQDFLIRYGTHYIKSAVYGGELKIVKKSKAEKKMTQEEFSKVAEKEFKAITNTLQSETSQKESSSSAFGYSTSSKESESKSKATNEQKSGSNSNQEQQNSEKSQESEFTETSVEAQGGSPMIAQALFDFYTPSFGTLFGQWIKTIPKYIRPFSFILREITELLNVNMDTLFPLGEVDFGCTGTNPQFSKNLKKDKLTGKKYYNPPGDFITRNESKKRNQARIFCRYNSLENLREKLDMKLDALQQAVAVYLEEGPAQTNTFLLHGGYPGCETDTLEYAGKGTGNKTNVMTYFKLKSEKFKVQFEMPLDISDVIGKQQAFHVIFEGRKWFAMDPDTEAVNPLAGCQLPETNSLKNPVCILGVVLTYDVGGFLIMDETDYKVNKKIFPDLDPTFINFPVAKVLEVSTLNASNPDASEPSIPCNVKWSNAHILDINQNHTCVNFIAASEGDIFVIFATIPKQSSTWYYVQITDEGVAFYKGLKLVYSRVLPGIGSLGDRILTDEYFVCVYHLSNNDLAIQYGKMPPGSDVGKVYASKRFNTRGKRQHLKYYAFGTGEKRINFCAVNVFQEKKDNVVCDTLWKMQGGVCLRECHEECKGLGQCETPRDPTKCHKCKHFVTIHENVHNCTKHCPPGYTASETEKNTCVQCPLGTYKNISGNDPCQLCEMGYHNDQLGASDCLPCSHGTHSPDLGATECLPCEKGHFAPELGMAFCNKCPLGEYAEKPHSIRCKVCFPGVIAPINGSSKCTKCEPGHYNKHPRQHKCKRCHKGSYQQHAGQRHCIDCDPGHFTNKVATIECEPCPIGYNQETSGQTKCKKCPKDAKGGKNPASVTCDNDCLPGTYSPLNDETCLKCPQGTYQKGSGAAECRKCPVGYYQPLKGQTKCEIAPGGTYVDTEGSANYILCPTGTFHERTGSHSRTNCTSCPKGFFADQEGSLKCKPCKPGLFQDNLGQSLCVPCQFGSFSNKLGSAACENCKKGSVTLKEGATNCTICEPGTIAFMGKNCKECGIGKYSATNFPNAVGHTDCHKCKAGTASKLKRRGGPCPICQGGSYTLKEGQALCISCKKGQGLKSVSEGCQSCPKGYFQDKTKQKQCKKCPVGYYSNTEGATSCQKCPKGRHQDQTGQTNCKICKEGFANNKPGSKLCTACRKGYYSKGEENFVCTPCKPGYYQPTTGKTRCLECEPGKFSKAGKAKCEDCPKGQFQPDYAQGECFRCKEGTISKEKGSKKCDPCKENTYIEKQGKSACKKCAAGLKAAPGSKICAGCEAGSGIGVVRFGYSEGRPGSYPSFNSYKLKNDIIKHTPQCAFENCKLEPLLKYWESDETDIWPKLLYFKFKKKQSIQAFSIDTVEGRVPIDKTRFSFYGSNSKDCADKNFDVLHEPTEKKRVSEFENNDKYYCYGFRFPRLDTYKTAAVRYPIKFYKRIDLKGGQCKKCIAGEFQPNSGGFACTSCPPGYYNGEVGQEECYKVCGAGEMPNSTWGATGCKKCPPGTYSETEGSPVCYACKPGTYTSKEGQTSCTNCTENWFMDLPGQKFCVPCPLGCEADEERKKCTGLSLCSKKYLDIKNDLYGKNDVRKNENSKTLIKKKKTKVTSKNSVLKLLPAWNKGKSWVHYQRTDLYPEKPKESEANMEEDEEEEEEEK